MSETERIAEQLKRAFEGEAWHGPAVQEVLAGVTAAGAAARPIASAHTEDMAGVDADHPLVAFGPCGEGRFPWRETRGHGSICEQPNGQSTSCSGRSATIRAPSISSTRRDASPPPTPSCSLPASSR